jgi:hypothetical protein
MEHKQYERTITVLESYSIEVSREVMTTTKTKIPNY